MEDLYKDEREKTETKKEEDKPEGGAKRKRKLEEAPKKGKEEK